MTQIAFFPSLSGAVFWQGQTEVKQLCFAVKPCRGKEGCFFFCMCGRDQPAAWLIDSMSWLLLNGSDRIALFIIIRSGREDFSLVFVGSFVISLSSWARSGERERSIMEAPLSLPLFWKKLLGREKMGTMGDPALWKPPLGAPAGWLTTFS